MQNDTSSTAYGGHATSAMPKSPLKSQSSADDAVFASLYSAIFDSKPSVSRYDVEESDHDSSSAHRHRQLYHSILVQDHQEMVNRHSRCLKHLQETSEEADALRRENVHLRSLNLELNKHLSLLIHASVQKKFGSPSSMRTTTPFGIVSGLGDMRTDDKRAEQDVSDESPTSVIESEGGDAENIDAERFSLPKSISVRSNGYVKAAQAAQAGASTATRTGTATTFNASQKVFVPIGVKEEEPPVELEVYNQGMFKTELCNKWQEVGECPYGDHCQFAHGIEELRPVIRHPRYKTNVCRMVLSGIVCPYGHRCHFRHALTENEKLMVPNKPSQRQFNLDRQSK
ncbi:zinc finger CCCH domain-containing protein 15-like [Pyrus x bretschneideri]|uniref:zinc finger CCCH domain-containing protein 15-like n=1 Tax=Pyrus x bretschneideri TaxID=225117 RepID=UPI00202EF861|nr:zinc finger CCCH domain-containing protein 15-like [Pyrus x bretschneideri]XP_048429043.1 zinc finger CCCH domain-containing protein 15-like [Pyrus x bretschneideri]